MLRIAGLALVPLAVLVACGGSSPVAPADTPSPAAGNTGWEKIYDRPVGPATAIEMYDDEFGLAIIGHGIERTTDGGLTWHETDSAHDFVGPIAIADRDHAWVGGAANVILRTSDGGVTWTPHPTGTQAPISYISAVSADEAWAAGYQQAVQGFPPHGGSALLHTTDGERWQSIEVPGYGIFMGVWFVGSDGWLLATQCHPGDPQDDPSAEPGAPGHAPCRDAASLLHTLDDGRSWEVLHQSPDQIPQFIERVSFTSAFGALPCTADCHGYAIYATSDGGHTWEQRAELGFQLGIRGLRFTSVSDGWVSGGECVQANCAFLPAMQRTRDGGHSWERIEVPADVGDWPLAATAVHVLIGASGPGVSIYDQRKGHWRDASTEAGPALSRVAFTTRYEGYATTDDGYLWITDDGGQRWSPRADGIRWTIAGTGALSAIGPNGTIRLSDDRGATWRDVPAPPHPAGSAPVVRAVDGASVWATTYGGLWRTDDAGGTWRQQDATPNATYGFIDAHHAWMSPCGSACDEPLRITSDGGETWQSRQVPQAVYPGFVFANPLDGWASPYNPDGGCRCLLATHDGGLTWQAVSTVPWSIAEFLPVDGQRAFAVGVTSLSLGVPPDILSSSDSGATWRKEFSPATPRGAFTQPQRFAARDGRVWLLDSTSRVNPPDAGYDPPRRTIIYRRDLERATPAAPTQPAP